MKTTASYHTHNTYCDGECSIEAMIEAAIESGLIEIGISSHAPLPFTTEWTMPLERLPAYVAEVRELGERYKDRIRVLLGLEVDYLPGEEVAAFHQEYIAPLEMDFTIGSVHFLGPIDAPREIDGQEEIFHQLLYKEYGGDIRTMVEEYYRRIPEVLSLPHVRIVGHIDRIKRWNANHRYFTSDEPWYREAVEAALRPIAASGVIVEINTSGRRRGAGEDYPAQWVLGRCKNLGIPAIVSADAHAPDEVVWGFEEAEAALDQVDIVPVRSLIAGR